MTGSIICGLDESAEARDAARVARRLSARLGLPLLFVLVVEPPAAEGAVAAAAERLQALSDRGSPVDTGANWVVEAGHPADRLVAVAEEEGASLIVVGSHGPRSSLLGSVSAEVSRRAPCPVVVVPPGAAGRGEPGVAGGIARLSLGANGEGPASDLVGGTVRFHLGAAAG
jgi:nucleotide-binding universal stress UspA family protein